MIVAPSRCASATVCCVASSLWGAQTQSLSRGAAVLVNQSAESIPSANAIELTRSDDAEIWSGLWWRESETAMRAMSVVVLDAGP